MKSIVLRPAEPEGDFGQLAVWFSGLEDERTTEPGLKEWYEKQRERIIQMVAIDTATGAWVAMSAITRLEGNDYAYNLFTGVDKLYRGRRLAQAVKVLALRYARDVLKANTVRTHHNIKNAPMIAIDRKLGYTQLPGTYLLEKILGQERCSGTANRGVQPGKYPAVVSAPRYSMALPPGC
jgi:RimJ/RimL family protein N-acetyltransferase